MNITLKKIIYILLIVSLIYILYLLYLFFISKNIIENFVWSPNIIKEFNKYEKTTNYNNVQFNLELLQNQVPQEDVIYLLKYGYWPWDENIQDLYKDAVMHNKIIKKQSDEALEYAKTIYNQNAVKKLLSWNTKEGQFLLYGAKTKDNNTIKCSNSSTNQYPNEESVLEKHEITGYNLWNGFPYIKKTKITNENIPNEIPGFQFVNNSCNPCSIFNDPNLNTYDCPFSLNIKEKTILTNREKIEEENEEISPIWKILWNIK
jgi:hypothetical protein